MGSRPASLALLVLVVLAGCATGPSTSGSQTPTERATTRTPSATTTPAPPVPLDAAKERALDAERTRVNAIIANASNVSGGTPGGTMSPEARALNVSEERVRVFVQMPYSYEYRCPGTGAGAADLATRVVYRITEGSTELVDVREGVRLVCN